MVKINDSYLLDFMKFGGNLYTWVKRHFDFKRLKT